jgi:hypothetical protein
MQLCEVKVRLAGARGAAHEVATTLSPEGARVYRINGRLRSAAQVKVRMHAARDQDRSLPWVWGALGAACWHQAAPCGCVALSWRCHQGAAAHPQPGHPSPPP